MPAPRACSVCSAMLCTITPQCLTITKEFGFSRDMALEVGVATVTIDL
jgi:hypothetical protein